MQNQNDVSKRHISNVNDMAKDMNFKSLINNDLFKNVLDKNLFICTQKIEKIITALYLITDVMDPQLPLTQSIRHESLMLMNAAYQLVIEQDYGNGSKLMKLIIRTEQITSLVSIGQIAHHISEMNAQVIISEMNKVNQVVIREAQELEKKYATYRYARSNESGMQPTLTYGILEDESFEQLQKEKRFPKPEHKTTLTTSINDNKGHSHLYKEIEKSLSVPKTTSKENIDNNDRKQAIINVIRSHKNASMLDIQKFVTGCSDKTLQREIVSLIASGIVRKEGDKRWATYHIV